jgi:CBS domain containing-hemolysin-like protein
MIPLAVFVVSVLILALAVLETAFGLLMRLPQRLEAERERGNEALSAYLEDPITFFIPARLVRSVLLVLVVVLLSLSEVFGAGVQGAALLFGSGVAIHLLVGHVLPALLVRRSPERVLDLLLPPFSAIANVLVPLTSLLVGWIGAAPPREPDEGPRRTDAVEPSDDEQQSRDENRLLRSVVNFSETLVREVMTPRPDIVAIRADATLEELRQVVREQEYSRLPVFTENLDNVVGTVVVKDLIQIAETGTDTVSEIMRPAAFVPETKRVVDLLREFQQKRFQLAIVVDEYGGTAGLVTVEDVIEELVGEIRDEYDSEAEPIVVEADDTFVFSAKVGIGEMVERIGREIEDGSFETVGGYVLARVGRVPAVGERFSFDGLEVEILEAERRRIHKVRIHQVSPPAAEDEA